MFYCKKCKNYTELDAKVDTREELSEALGSPTFTVNCASCEEETETHVNYIYAQKDFGEKYGSSIIFAIILLFVTPTISGGYRFIVLLFPAIAVFIYSNSINKKLKTFNTNKTKASH